MKLTSPSGKVYTWEGDTPPTQADIDAIIAHDAVQSPARNAAPAPSSFGSMSPYGLNAGQTPGMTPEAMAQVAKFAREGATQGGLTAAGQYLGAMTGPAAPVAVPALGAVGSTLGYLANVAFDPNAHATLGGAGAAAVQGLVPGSSLSKYLPIKQAVAGAVAPQVESFINKGEAAPLLSSVEGATLGYAGGKIGEKLDTGKKMSDIALKESQNSPFINAIKEGLDVGYKFNPAKTNDSAVTSAIVGLSGGASVSRKMSKYNQEVTNNLIREEVGLPKKSPVTMEVLQDKAEKIGQIYEDFKNLAPDAAPLVEQWKEANKKKNLYFKEYAKSGSVDSYVKAQEFKKIADQSFGQMDDLATRTFKPEMSDAIKKARVDLAKIHDVERVLSVSGNVDANALGRAYDRMSNINRIEPMTGNLGKIARVASAASDATRLSENVGAPGGNWLKTLGMFGPAVYGAMSGDIREMAVGAAIPAASAVSKYALMTSPVQRALSVPSYGYPLMDTAANVARFIPQAAQPSSQPNP